MNTGFFIFAFLVCSIWIFFKREKAKEHAKYRISIENAKARIRDWMTSGTITAIEWGGHNYYGEGCHIVNHMSVSGSGWSFSIADDWEIPENIEQIPGEIYHFFEGPRYNISALEELSSELNTDEFTTRRWVDRCQRGEKVPAGGIYGPGFTKTKDTYCVASA